MKPSTWWKKLIVMAAAAPMANKLKDWARSFFTEWSASKSGQKHRSMPGLHRII